MSALRQFSGSEADSTSQEPIASDRTSDPKAMGALVDGYIRLNSEFDPPLEFKRLSLVREILREMLSRSRT